MKFRVIKSLTLIMSACLLLLTGCGQKVVEVDTSSKLDSSSQVSSASSELEPKLLQNPLTGLYDMEPASKDLRPVAVMVNNVSVAQSVQTGLDQADIVYEAYAEGGVTRLLAVFKDIKKADNIGTIRSARYSYIDLAMGHDAIYVHAGINDSHATPHVKETGIDNINLLHGKYSGMSFREKNGKALEHTLYTTGEKLSNGFSKLKWRTELKRNKENWQSFVAEDAEVTPNSGSCTEATVKMSTVQTSKFKYNAETGKYQKFNKDKAHKDYKTGKQLEFKNVLILKTAVTNLSSDGYIVKTGLTGGEGYYLSNGGYSEIKWEKGDEKDPLKISLKDGSECPFNPGNTWVCLVNKKNTVKVG